MKKEKYNVAVVGATGAVGNEMISILEERNFPVDRLKLLASTRGAGTRIEFHGNSYTVEVLNENSFAGVDIGLFSAGGSVSDKFAPIAGKAGCVVMARVRGCLEEARQLIQAGYPGAALVRAAAGIEVTIRFFLARPLVQGAFLSDDWAQLLSQKVLHGRTAEDRELLPSILRNWNIEITAIKLSSGSQVWEQIVSRVWPHRNDYVHMADAGSRDDAGLAVECLEALLSRIVDPLAQRLGFTREQTGCWSIVAVTNPPEFPNLNPPRRYKCDDPFK